jgi:hypothetical protein
VSLFHPDFLPRGRVTGRENVNQYGVSEYDSSAAFRSFRSPVLFSLLRDPAVNILSDVL